MNRSICNKYCIFRLILCVLIILWCVLIFCMSSENAQVSGDRSEGVVVRLINSLLSIFGIDSSNKVLVDSIEVLVRKSAHISLYFVLSVLTSLFAYTYAIRFEYRYISVFLFSYFYASSDEIHQLYVPGRSGSIKDVLIDSIGIILGIVFVRVLYYFYCRYKKTVN